MVLEGTFFPKGNGGNHCNLQISLASCRCGFVRRRSNRYPLLLRNADFGKLAATAISVGHVVRALRKKLNMTQAEFARRFHLPLGTIRDWEQGAHRADKAAQVLLTVVAKDPEAVARALES